jgi:hypothetical protein
MTSGSIVARAAHVLSEKNSISICLPNNPTLDAVAAGTALYMGLSALGKNIGLSCESQINPEFGIIGQDKIQSTLIADGDNLVVSFPYTEGSVDKVTYNIETDVFNLIIQPREGFSRLDPQKVKFSYAGGKPDAIVTIYAPTFNSLGKLYSAQPDQFTGVDIINIDRHFTNANFGSVNFVDKKSSSMSEMVLSLLQELKVTIDKDIATNLYTGIASATNNFSAHSVTAETFEMIALLMKSGAVKKPIYTMNALGINKANQQSFAQPFSPQLGQPQQPFGQQFSGYQPMQVPQAPMSQFNQMQQPQQAQQPQFMMNQPEMQQMNSQMNQQMNQPMQMGGASAEFSEPKMSLQVQEAPIAPEIEQQVEMVENKEVKPDEDSSSNQNVVPQQEPQQQEPQQKTPKDWLKPKIFKGTNLV